MQPSAHGDYLISKGWEPIGCNSRDVEMWQEPDLGRRVRTKKVEVPSKGKDVPSTFFERTIVSAMPGTYTTNQALFIQRKRDTETKVA